MLDGNQQRIVLAHASPFAIGAVHFHPAHRLLSNGNDNVIVEPRVMQLFVALARAGDAVLSREDLIEQCWGGRIVGDNAIQRAISHARKLSAQIGEGAFEIETIKGVGYRLRKIDGAPSKGAAPVEAEPRGFSWVSRRAVLAAGSATAVAAAGAVGFLVAPSNRPTALARELYHLGEAARRAEHIMPGEQAVALYSEAVRESPDFAAAWGGLALAYCDLMSATDADQLGRVASLTIAAARQALEIDPANRDAALALIRVRPAFRRWAEAEAQAASLSGRGPRSWPVHAYRGMLAASTGRHDPAIGHFSRALEVEPLLPRVHGALAYANWAAGRLHDTDRLLEQGTRRWPRSWWLWNARFQFLAFEGQFEQAVRQVADETRRPWNLSMQAIPRRLELARALQERHPEDIRRSIERHLAEARENERAVALSALSLSALGAQDETYDLLRGFYLGTGPYPTAINAHSRRPTWFLFVPPLRRFLANQRFGALLGSIGLDRS